MLRGWSPRLRCCPRGRRRSSRWPTTDSGTLSAVERRPCFAEFVCDPSVSRLRRRRGRICAPRSGCSAVGHAARWHA
eukprot:4217348-Pyramimonas_sp.AAC.1